MIIPVSHENNEVRRLPWISFFIILSCFLIHIDISNRVEEQTQELKYQAREYLYYLINHPYLEIDVKLSKKLKINRKAVDRIKLLSRGRGNITPDEALLKEEQEEFDKMGEKLIRLSESFPFNKWGYIPKRKEFLKSVTYMFIHGGWLHLIGNLLLLYLTGPYIEDLWGRIVYPVFYIIVGMFSAFMYMLRFPEMNIPLIGASGAIAGLMGAFLVYFWNTKIKFVYFFFFGIFGTFKAPAWIMLPLWFGFEAFDASQVSKMNTGGGGVAHHVHVWGFVFGVLIALVFKLTKLDSRYLSKKIEEKISFIDAAFEEYTKAKDLFDQDKKEEAFISAMQSVKSFPTNQELVELLWRAGFDLKRRSEVIPYMKRLIEHEIVKEKIDLALTHYGELKRDYPDQKINLSYEISILKHLLKRGDTEWAVETAGNMIPRFSDKTPPGLISEFAGLIVISEELTKKIGSGLAGLLKKITVIDEEKKNQLLTKIKSSGISIEADDTGPAESKKTEFKIYEAVLSGISKERIKLKFGNGQLKSIPVASIKGISVWRIAGGEIEFELTIDFFIDSFSNDADLIRIIRVEGKKLDLMKFVPKANDRIHALKIFLSFLIKSSGAKSVPDEDVTGLKRFQEFRSSGEYENYLRLLLKSGSD